MKQSTQQGVLIYFEYLEALEQLPLEEVGALFLAVLKYGKTGELTELENGAKILFPMLRGSIDRNTERYNETCRTNAYNSYRASCKRNSEEPLSREEWETKFPDGHRAVSVDVEGHLTKPNKTETVTVIETKPNEIETNQNMIEIESENEGVGEKTNIVVDYRAQTDEDFERRRNEKLNSFDSYLYSKELQAFKGYNMQKLGGIE